MHIVDSIPMLYNSIYVNQNVEMFKMFLESQRISLYVTKLLK